MIEETWPTNTQDEVGATVDANHQVSHVERVRHRLAVLDRPDDQMRPIGTMARLDRCWLEMEGQARADSPSAVSSVGIAKAACRLQTCTMALEVRAEPKSSRMSDFAVGSSSCLLVSVGCEYWIVKSVREAETTDRFQRW